jgi:hypothetical protein
VAFTAVSVGGGDDDGGWWGGKLLRVNEDRPISHSFEGSSVAEVGTVSLASIDVRDGWDEAATYLAGSPNKVLTSVGCQRHRMAVAQVERRLEHAHRESQWRDNCGRRRTYDGARRLGTR